MGSKCGKEIGILGLWESVGWEWKMGLGPWINDVHQDRECGRKSTLDISQINIFQSTD